MYLCRELTELSLPKIGQQFGGRDHTTVMHADRKIRELMAERRAIYNQVTELTTRIKQQADPQRHRGPARRRARGTLSAVRPRRGHGRHDTPADPRTLAPPPFIAPCRLMSCTSGSKL